MVTENRPDEGPSSVLIREVLMEALGAMRTNAAVGETGLGCGLLLRRFRSDRRIGSCEGFELA